MDRQIALPTYEVEFIPLERRLREDAVSIQRVTTAALSGARVGAGETTNWHRQSRGGGYKSRFMGE